MPAGAPNLVGLTQYDNQPNFFTDSVILSQGAGYGMVVGFGMFFALLTVLLVFADYRARGGRHYNSEDFNTAGRTIKTGLIAVDVVSHWCGRALLCMPLMMSVAMRARLLLWHARAPAT